MRIVIAKPENFLHKDDYDKIFNYRIIGYFLENIYVILINRLHKKI